MTPAYVEGPIVYTLDDPYGHPEFIYWGWKVDFTVPAYPADLDPEYPYWGETYWHLGVDEWGDQGWPYTLWDSGAEIQAAAHLHGGVLFACSIYNPVDHSIVFPTQWSPNPASTIYGTTWTSSLVNDALRALSAAGGGTYTVYVSDHKNSALGYQFYVSNLWYCNLSLNYRTADPDGGGEDPPHTEDGDNVGLCTARYRETVATAWCTAANGGVKQVMIAVNRGIRANIGTGTGSTGGWEVYSLGDIDAASFLGLAFLPNGYLVLTYDTFDPSRNRTGVYRVNKMLGSGSTNWSLPLALTPNVSQILTTDNDHHQTWRYRVG